MYIYIFIHIHLHYTLKIHSEFEELSSQKETNHAGILGMIKTSINQITKHQTVLFFCRQSSFFQITQKSFHILLATKTIHPSHRCQRLNTKSLLTHPPVALTLMAWYPGHRTPCPLLQCNLQAIVPAVR